MFQHTLTSLALLFLVLLVGCDKTSKSEKAYDDLGLVEVTGTITVDGNPLSGVQVQFEENGSFAYSVTDSEGRYRMQFDTHHNGVKPGKKTVRLWTTLQGPGFDELMQGAYPEKEIIPVQYNHQSTLSAEVVQGKSQSFDFDLKKKGKAINAPSHEG